MITQDFKDGCTAVFHDDGSVSFELVDGILSNDAFMEFMPLAMHVYHSRQPQFGCAPQAPYSAMGGKRIGGKIAKKRGRPATKTATAKRGRSRKA